MTHDGKNGVDIAAWTRQLPGGTTETLIMAVQMNYIGFMDKADFGIIGIRGRLVKVLFGDVREEAGLRFRMGRTSVAAAIIRDDCKSGPASLFHPIPSHQLALQVGRSGSL